MKIMLLVMDEQRVILDRLYAVVRENCDDCTIYRLSKPQQMKLGKFLASVNYEDFDRVVIFSRVKRLAPQLSVLKCIPGLIFLEHDAYQNYMPESKYQGVYSRLYRRLPSCRALVSGAVVARRMQAENIDAVFVSKGYDEQMLRNTDSVRDIPIGFLGSLKSTEYAQRKALLESLVQRTGMLVTRTQSGREYLETLNRIKIFVSADLGMGEFMIKNFEAMACGCVLLAWSQARKIDCWALRTWKTPFSIVPRTRRCRSSSCCSVIRNWPRGSPAMAKPSPRAAILLRVSGGPWPRKSSVKCAPGKPLRYSLADGSSCVMA